MSYVHILQHGCIILVTLSRDLFKIYDPLVSVQDQFKNQIIVHSCMHLKT